MTAHPLRLMCILAHPDDETLGTGGTLARYAREGVETHVLTATRGDAGRHGPPDTPHPGREALGGIREAELREAAHVLGVHDVRVLGYPDGRLDAVDGAEALERVVAHVRRVRPHVIVTFDAFGAYGHPDHIAVSQLATSACMAAADPSFQGSGARPHGTSKLYYMAWPPELWAAYQKAFKRLVSTVDGVERVVRPWPEWAITTRIDASEEWRTVWSAVQCHETQTAIYASLQALDEDVHRVLWGRQSFYRAYSVVNGGRSVESDLFEGIR